jgi:hypothetical protein
MTAWYSATLLVAFPMYPERLAAMDPSCTITYAQAASPGFPRDAPSVYRVTVSAAVTAVSSGLSQ